jgi:nucleoside-diphosphate-sugar epimerase
MNNNKPAIVCDAGGFTGGHLVNRLKEEGYWVRGIDIKENEYGNSDADNFIIGDLRDPLVCDKLFDRKIN